MASAVLAWTSRVAALAAAVAGAGALWQSPLLAGLLARISRGIVFAVPTTQPAVALTFDDGPDPELTPALAGVLARHGAAGTFFLQGSRAAAHPGLVADLVRGGAEVANHLWDDRPSALLRGGEFRRHLAATDVVLRRAGARPAFVRPGSGWVRPGMMRTARGYGYRTALGSITLRDLRLRDPERALRFVVRRLRPGAVVVLHEGSAERAGIVSLTDRLLTVLDERGLRAVPLSELVAG